jgi:excisionase family DNA binding protein
VKTSNDAKNSIIIKSEVLNPLWLSISEAAKFGGVKAKTIRRAILTHQLKYKISGNKYLVEFSAVIIYLNKTQKLKNKLLFNGIGQYIKEWQT